MAPAPSTEPVRGETEISVRRAEILISTLGVEIQYSYLVDKEFILALEIIAGVARHRARVDQSWSRPAIASAAALGHGRVADQT